MKTPRTLALTALAAITLLLATTTPASANGPFPIDVVAGSFTHIAGTFDLTPGSQIPVPCPEKPTTLAMTFDGNAASGTWTISGTKSRQTQLLGGSWYQIDVSYLPGSGGTYTAVGSPPPTDTLAGTMGIQIQIYLLQQAGSPLTCTKTNLRCTIRGAFALTAGDFTGNPLPNPQPGDTLDLSSSTAASGFPMAVFSCPPPFNGVFGGTHATLVQNIVFQ